MKLLNRIGLILLAASLSLAALAKDPGGRNDHGFPSFDVTPPTFHAPVPGDLTHPTSESLKPRGSFGGGGGGRSFGGGGGGRSFGGGGSSGSFGGRSSSSGSFSSSGGGFGGPSMSPRTGNSSGPSSFGRSGQMGRSGPITSSPINRGGTGFGRQPAGTSVYYMGGRPYYGYGGYWGDYSYGWWHPAWYYYTPFHPAFYMSPPYMGADGFYHSGGFSLSRAIGGLCCCPLIVVGIIWLFARGGGSRRTKYTMYK